MLTELRPGSVSGRQTDIAVAQIPTHPSPPPSSSSSISFLSVIRVPVCVPFGAPARADPELVISLFLLGAAAHWSQSWTGLHGRCPSQAALVSSKGVIVPAVCSDNEGVNLSQSGDAGGGGGVGWGALSLDPVRSNCTTLSLLIDIIWNSTSSKWICLIKHVKTVTCEKKNHFWELNLVFRCEGLESCLWSAGSVDLGLTHKTEWRWTDIFLLQLTDHFPWLKRSKGLEDGREGGGEEFKTKSLSVLNPLLSDFTSFSLFREIPADSCKQSCKWSVRGAGRGAVTLHGLTVRVYNTKPAQFRLWHAG